MQPYMLQLVPKVTWTDAVCAEKAPFLNGVCVMFFLFPLQEGLGYLESWSL